MKRKTILIAGGTGLIGQAIIQELDKQDVEIRILSRSKRQSTAQVRYFQWDTNKKTIEAGALDGVDTIINLAGAGIADKRWTAERKQQLIDSRVDSAACFVLALHELPRTQRPSSYISASAIGVYGDAGNSIKEEDDETEADGFLAACTRAWETAAYAMEALVERVCIIRVGIVFSRTGGAFPKIVLPFKFRMASYFGDGSMGYSWIHIDDIAAIFVHAIESDQMEGVYNGVAPDAQSNKALVQAIHKEIGGPFITHGVPKFMLRLVLGEMADVVLTGSYVSSRKIEATGFQFKYPSLDTALKDLLG